MNVQPLPNLLSPVGAFDCEASYSGARLQFWVGPSSVNRQPFASSVLEGLSSREKWLSCSWFYDRRGSELFEQICRLPEYYLTRAETAILCEHAPEIAGLCGQHPSLVELGSGSSTKTRLLIEAFQDQRDRLTYCPIDISAQMLHSSSLDLLNRFPRLQVSAVAADYLEGLRRLDSQVEGPRLVLFLGSTIGNFEPGADRAFLNAIRGTMDPDDRLLLGADLKKDPGVIEAAYNDSAGLTEAFNKNLLVRINHELGGEFDPDAFLHRAPYVPDRGRVEMRLFSRREQEIRVRELNRTFRFEKGESIFTESCQKYSLSDLRSLARSSGLEFLRTWRDPDGLFSLSLLAPGQ